MSGVAAAWSPSFSDRVQDLLEKVDYRLAETDDEREAIFRLRHDAYLREGAITPNFSKRVADRFDDTENVWIFGLYIEGRLASSIRIHVASKQHPISPSLDVFPDVLQPEIDAGKTLVDPTRFVADFESARQHPELPYLTVRLGYVASAYFNADLGIAAVRPEHQAFYKRIYMMKAVTGPRPFPGLTKPISLMTVHFPTVRDEILRRYPFFRSTVFERRMLFERRAHVPQLAATLPNVAWPASEKAEIHATG